MKNIYIVDEFISSQKNGIGTFLKELLYCFKSFKYNINLLIFNAETKEFNITHENDTTNYLFPVLKQGQFFKNPKIIEKILRLYILDSTDNIFFINHSPCSDFIKSLKKAFPKSKIIFTIHDFGWTSPLMGNINEYQNIIKERASKIVRNSKEKYIIKYYEEEKEIYRLSDRVVCLSKDSYDILHSIYELRSNKISLIPNGLKETKIAREQKDIESIRDSLHVRLNEKIILVIGRPTKEKGIFALIDAMKLVLEENKNVRLVIIGSANEQKFKELIQKASSHTTFITFTGLLNQKELYKWINIADIGVIPSYYEQFGFAGVEMMMHGLPIIASNGMGIRNMFQDNINGMTVEIGDRNQPKEYVQNLSIAILKLMNSSSLCRCLSIGSLKTYKERYEINNMRKGYKELIESL